MGAAFANVDVVDGTVVDTPRSDVVTEEDLAGTLSDEEDNDGNADPFRFDPTLELKACAKALAVINSPASSPSPQDGEK